MAEFGYIEILFDEINEAEFSGTIGGTQASARFVQCAH